MKVALGLKAHSGWAVLVVVGSAGDGLQVIDRRRIELVEEGAAWAKQPYHAAERLNPREARELVKRGTQAAYQIARREIKLAVKRLREQQHDVLACAVLVANPMPDWSTAEILAVHFRMHKAEGVLFPDALARGADECGLNLVRIPEKLLSEHAEEKLAAPLADVMKEVMTLGKSVGAPWGKDQKNAALAAIIALRCFVI
ncbi:MAG TPA: hypothetical protein VGW76_00665 [Pyrinomonadaceae bacterium]|nr:hypothetical protein [Pyrinomonadaceae bacterium]